MIDLHVHTTASDGQYSPSEIIFKAKEKNLTAIAITDHDTIDGLEEGKKAAENSGIKFIPGVELNIKNPTGEFHLLGLGLKKCSPSLESVINNLQENRITRNQEMFEKIREKFPDTSWEELEEDFPNTVIGRPHFARYLVKKGFVKNTQKAFDLYLAKGRPCYVSRSGANLDEAVLGIKESGGYPVIAHPMSLYLSWGKLPDALLEIHEHGVEGLEAFHSGARATDCFRLREVGEKLGFFITAGSDFHGEKIRADRKLGHTCGEKKITDYLLPDMEKLLEMLGG